MNKEFLPVLPIIILGLIMTILGKKIAKKNAELVKCIYDVCFLGSGGGLIFAAAILVLTVFFPNSSFLKWLLEETVPVNFAASFAMNMVCSSIARILPQDTQEEDKQSEAAVRKATGDHESSLTDEFYKSCTTHYYRAACQKCHRRRCSKATRCQPRCR